MIRKCNDGDFETILSIINDAAQAYKGIIPVDCWQEPYMPGVELADEIANGISFWCYEEAGQLIGVMGIQFVQDVTLIRHAYVRTTHRHQGVGSKLLALLCSTGDRPILIGTWAAAVWAIRFYQNHGFRLVSHDQKEVLLRRYWSIPERQVETSVVLAQEKWFKKEGSSK